jgi:triosephosphate isomerase
MHHKKPPFIAGNWKMHMTIQEAKSLAAAIIQASFELAVAEIVLIPPFTALRSVKKLAGESPVRLGAQNRGKSRHRCSKMSAANTSL